MLRGLSLAGFCCGAVLPVASVLLAVLASARAADVLCTGLAEAVDGAHCGPVAQLGMQGGWYQNGVLAISHGPSLEGFDALPPWNASSQHDVLLLVTSDDPAASRVPPLASSFAVRNLVCGLHAPSTIMTLAARSALRTSHCLEHTRSQPDMDGSSWGAASTVRSRFEAQFSTAISWLWIAAGLATIGAGAPLLVGCCTLPLLRASRRESLPAVPSRSLLRGLDGAGRAIPCSAPHWCPSRDTTGGQALQHSSMHLAVSSVLEMPSMLLASALWTAMRRLEGAWEPIAGRTPAAAGVAVQDLIVPIGVPYVLVTGVRLLYLGTRWVDGAVHVVMAGEIGLIVTITVLSLMAQELQQREDLLLRLEREAWQQARAEEDFWVPWWPGLAVKHGLEGLFLLHLLAVGGSTGFVGARRCWVGGVCDAQIEVVLMVLGGLYTGAGIIGLWAFEHGLHECIADVNCDGALPMMAVSVAAGCLPACLLLAALAWTTSVQLDLVL